MKTRVTFRVAKELANALRELPNQTDFVERALRDALGQACPVCEGAGRISARSIRVSNFRASALPQLDRGSALQLRGLVQLARKLAATNLELSAGTRKHEVGFVLARAGDVLLRGKVTSTSTSLEPN
jgi:hypothetical protein